MTNDDSPAIVLDKSFLQSSTAKRIRELAKQNVLIVSDALFYELLTAPEPGRTRCFAKFPTGENPVALVSHAGTLMRLEIEGQKPSGRPSKHREKLRFQFNPRLMSPDYVLPESAATAVDEHTAELRSDVSSFLQRVNLVPTFFPDLLTGTQEAQRRAVADAEQAIAKQGSLIPFYSKLTPPPGEPPLPAPHLVSEEWAIYRWLQVQFLFAVDVYVRYGGKLPETMSPRTYEKMEHDVLDAQVLVLGCLEGAFGTREKKLRRWWTLLRPEGLLYE